MGSYNSSQVAFLTNWFVASTKFLADDDIVVVEDDVTVGLITNVSIMQQMESPFGFGGQQRRPSSF